MSEQLHDWKDDFKIKKELLHGDFAAIELALFELPNAAFSLKKFDYSVVHGAWFKAAIKAGWIEAPECTTLFDKKEKKTVYLFNGTDVDKLDAKRVLWYGEQVINRHDAELEAEDPKN